MTTTGHEQNHGERAHSPFGFSAAKRWLNCTASVRICQDLPNVSGAAAAEGTMLHEIAAELLLCEFSNKKIPDALMDRYRNLTDEQRNTLNDYRNFVRDCQEELGNVAIETKISLPDLHQEFFGTADCIAYGKGIIRVVDFKAGAGVTVDVEDEDGDINPQLVGYLLGSLAALGWLITEFGVVPTVSDKRYRFERFEVAIVQPRRGGIKKTSLSILDLEDWAVRFADAAARADASPEFVTGDWCGFCPNRANCGALRSRALTAAKVEFDDGFSVARVPGAGVLSDQEIANILSAAPYLKKWLQGIETEAFNRAKSGREVPGYKIVEGIGNRKWVNEQETLDFLMGTQLFDADDLVETSLRSPGQIEELLKAAGLKPEYLPASHIVRLPTGPKLVPVSDKRPAMRIDAVSDFSSLPPTD